MRLADGGLEGRQVDLPQRTLANDGIGIEARELRVIADEMLDGGADVLRLHSLDVGNDNLRGKKRVFAEVLVVATVHGGAIRC